MLAGRTTRYVMSRPSAEVWNVTSCILTVEVSRGWSEKEGSSLRLQAVVRSKTAQGNAMRAILLLLETKFMGSKFALDDGRRLTGASQSHFSSAVYGLPTLGAATRNNHRVRASLREPTAPSALDRRKNPPAHPGNRSSYR